MHIIVVYSKMQIYSLHLPLMIFNLVKVIAVKVHNAFVLHIKTFRSLNLALMLLYDLDKML